MSAPVQFAAASQDELKRVDEMPNEPKNEKLKGRAERVAAFANAVHSLRIEGRKLDPATVPEYGAVIGGSMSFDEAAARIVRRYRKA